MLPVRDTSRPSGEWDTSLSHSIERAHAGSLTLPRVSARWAEAAVALLLATVAAVVLVEAMMSPPLGELGALAMYLAGSGVLTVLSGWLALSAAERVLGLTVRQRSFVGASLGSAIALVNVLVIAQLMFISKEHDLPLLLAVVAFSAIVTLFFVFRVAGVITSRIEIVADGIQALARGDYSARIAVGGTDEVRWLADDVNTLAGRLQGMEEERAALEHERRDLTAAVSHDLRTPLASVRAMVEALDDGVVEDGDETARYYATIRREIDRMDRMIGDLFELSRLDAGAVKLDRQRLALQEIAAEVVDAMQAQAKSRGVRLMLDVHGTPADVAVDGARIERALSNLVRNALEHTPRGGRVVVGVEANDSAVIARVSDSGDGIDPADLPRVWERFYRAERSRARRNEAGDGAGLGLAIVRGIVEAHGGTVGVQSTRGTGATFEMRLPKAMPG